MRLRESLSELCRERAFTALFFGGLAVWALALRADAELESFAGRPISAASFVGVSSSARLFAYALCAVAFPVSGLCAAWLVRWLAARLGKSLGGALEAASFGGVVLLAFAACRAAVIGLVALVVATQLALCVCAALDARVFRRALHADRGRLALLFAATALALAIPLVAGGESVRWRLVAATAAGTLVLHVIAQMWTRAEGPRVAQLVRALAPLCAIPALVVVAREVALAAHAHGASALLAHGLGALVWPALALWCVRRARLGAHASVDLERELGACALPWLLAGLYAWTRWQLRVEAPLDLFEPGNGALSEQELLMRGRLPFVETFDGHGLSGHLLGILFSAVHSSEPGASYGWDWVAYLVGFLCGYALVRRVLASAAFAALLAVGLFGWRELFPETSSIALVWLFVLERAVRVRSSASWTLALALVPLAWAWRLDIGAGVTLATFVVWAGVRTAEPASAPRAASFAARAALVASACALVFALVALARGVDPLERARDLWAVLGTGPSFARERIAPRIDHVVAWRTIAIPVLALALAIGLWVRALAQRSGARELAAPLYLVAFTLAVLPRSLERHTYDEGSPEFVSSFSFAILVLAPAWCLGASTTTRALAALLALALPLALSMQRQTTAPRGTLYARAEIAVARSPSIDLSSGRIARTIRRRDDETRRVDTVAGFLRDNLRDEETFLDLSNSPMLYVHARARPPHWLNHTMIAQGEALQRSFVRDLARADVPLVLLCVEPDLLVAQASYGFPSLDGVDFALRQYRLYEHVFADYEPLGLIERWQVWSRRGFEPRAAPSPAQRDELLRRLARATETNLGELARLWATTVDTGAVLRELRFSPAASSHEAPARAAFDPLAEDERIVHVVLELGTSSERPVDVRVAYGDPGGRAGSFRFVLRGARETIALRPSIHWRWWSERVEWIVVEGLDGPLEVVSGRIVAGD